MYIAVSGSIAYDYIMDYRDRFKDHILPEKIHILNVAFNIDELKKNSWWTWMNISYNLSLLWEKSILLWAIWYDYELNHMLNINYDYIHQSKFKLTASAHMITDMDNNQIIAFYTWAMDEADQISIWNVSEPISYYICSPDKPAAMVKNIKVAAEKWIKTFFDPWQALSALTKEDLIVCISQAEYLIVNEYEMDMMIGKTWLSKDQIVGNFEKVIITLWKSWSVIIDDDWANHIKAIETKDVIDPTWAWDAFRAWLLKWLNVWLSWEKSVKIWTLVANYCIKVYWTQKHKFTINEFIDTYKSVYWEDLNLNNY